MVLPYLCRYLTNCIIPKQMEPAEPEMLRHPSSVQAAWSLGSGMALPCTPWQPTPGRGGSLTNTPTHVTAPQTCTVLAFCSRKSTKILPVHICVLLWIIAVPFLIGDPPSTGASAFWPWGPGGPVAMDSPGPVVTVPDTLTSAAPLQNSTGNTVSTTHEMQ